MKIVYCIAGTYNSGGMERVLANKSNALVKAGNEVIIVTTDQRGQQPFFPLDAAIKSYDLDVNYEVNNGKSFLNKLIHFPLKQWQHKKRLTRLLKKLKADVVVSMFCNDAGFLPKIKDGSHKILEIHFSRFKRLQYGRKGIWKWADRWRSHTDKKTVARFERFVVLTEEDKGYWGNLENMVVIPNARTFTVDTPAALDNKQVIAVGRYSYQKGLDRLLAAWQIVCQKVPDWKLHLVGDGDLRGELESQIERLGLQERVVLGRAVTDMPSVYQNASILALSSHYEGLPMVLLEAQATGLPIVSFACKCGPKDVITDGEDGYLVEEGDVPALAERLMTLIKNDSLRKNMGKVAYENSQRFTEEKIMQRWVDLFNDVCAK